MASRRIPLAAALSLGAVVALLVSTASTLAARRPRNLYVGTDTASGPIGVVLGSTEFLLTLADGHALAVNLTAGTRVTNEAAGASTANGSTTSTTTGTAAFATGEYAVVHYRFTPAAGAVALAVTLSASPIATGKPHRLDGLVTSVGTGSLVLEGQNGVSWTITLLPTTRTFTQAGATPALAVGEFASVIVRSGSGINDAISVTYGLRPYGQRTEGLSGRLVGVAGQSVTLALASGASRSVQVLPSATVSLNRQASSLAALTPGDTVRVEGSMFQSIFYVYAVQASSGATANG